LTFGLEVKKTDQLFATLGAVALQEPDAVEVRDLKTVGSSSIIK